MKTIAYFSEQNPFEDKKAWSGSIYKIREGIEMAGFKIKWIPFHSNKILHLVIRICNNIFSKKILLEDHNPLHYYLCAFSINKKLLDECDYYFFPNNAQIIKYLHIKKRTIYFTDATFNIMVGYYWKNLSSIAVSQGNKCEAAGIQNSFINIRSSQWAIDSVINDYHGNASKTYVLEFGANIDDKYIKPIKPYQSGRLNILFSGIDWERKGANIAINTLIELNQMGIDAHLNLVGIPPENIPHEYQNIPNVNYIGFLNKNKPDEYFKYTSIISNSHILLLPTKAECSAIVYCEAAGYGIPIFTYDTGGISNYCINNLNGFRLPLTSTSHEFALKIAETIKNDKMKELHKGAIELYKNKLNWKSWSKRFRNIMEENNLV